MDASKPDTPQRPRRRLYLLHRWIALIFAVIGSLVFFRGAVATFHSEIVAWSQRSDGYPYMRDVAGFDIDATLREAMADVPAELRHNVQIGQFGDGLSLFFSQAVTDASGEQVQVGVGKLIDPGSGELLRRGEGPRPQALAPEPQATLAHFFVELHIFLLLPRTLGLIATGLVGFALLLLAITGIWVYKPSWRKLTRGPRTQRRRTLFADVHTLVGAWSLPFTLVMAVTGAFYSFASTVLIPVAAVVAFDGDMDELQNAIRPTLEVAASEATAEVAPMLRDASERSGGARLRFANLEHWGEDGARATLRMIDEHPLGDEHFTYVYTGHTGEFMTELPVIGTAPSFGAKLIELVGLLHFGTLFGIATKLLWGISGLAVSGLVATGLLIYVSRQRDDSRANVRAMRALAVALSSGLLLTTALCVATWAVVCALGVGDPETAMIGTLILGLLVSAGVGLRWPLRKAMTVTLATAGLGLAGLPLLALVANDLSLAQAWSGPHAGAVIAIDLLLVVSGVALLAIAARMRRDAPGRVRP